MIEPEIGKWLSFFIIKRPFIGC
ncbi:hypothetical protein V12B01_12915 [Vibrio splendidus 12B01]|nr:hypothetical protein V12B01_12915 [Vibrio splendidus 12B01]EAQ54967.1 hypothetical protein MED222_05115 [Vibrio sp. MED222]